MTNFTEVLGVTEDLSKLTAIQAAGYINKTLADKTAVTWARRELIAGVSEARNWTVAQLEKDGEAAKWLEVLQARSASKLSELAAYAHPNVRGKVGAVKDAATTMKSNPIYTPESGKPPANETLGQRLITHLKKGLTLEEAVKKSDAKMKAAIADRAKAKADPAVRYNNQLGKFESSLKVAYDTPSIALWKAQVVKAFDLLVAKETKSTEETADLPNESETPDAGVVAALTPDPDLTAQIAAMGEMLAALTARVS